MRKWNGSQSKLSRRPWPHEESGKRGDALSFDRKENYQLANCPIDELLIEMAQLSRSVIGKPKE
ncbi:hypothetical protein GCM10010872_33260 [Dyella flava]|nr:hypothetical protein GCM10010872_33260 [Dyella flava]